MDQAVTGAIFAGRFEIERPLGVGGMGTVFLARHVVLDRCFAIKLIRRALRGEADVAARFRREARAASRLAHPNITAVIDFGCTDEGVPYLVMEHVEGENLADVLRDGALPTARAVDILLQVADALAIAHGAQVIHRDVKPQNIILTTHRGVPDHVKILDFGLAKIVGASEALEITGKHDRFGTPAYMAPEQLLDGPVDHRCDIYGWGVLAFQLLVGHAPFQGQIAALARGHLEQQPPPPSRAARRDDIPAAIDALVLRCLAKRPADRPQSAASIVAELVGLQAQLGLARRARRTSAVHEPAAPWRAAAGDAPADGAARPPAATDLPRTRLLDELAHTVRDRGLGSALVTEALTEMLETEDRVLDLAAELDSLQQRLAALETRARAREARLRHALNLIGPEPGTRWWAVPAAPAGVGEATISSRARLAERAAELARRLERGTANAERELAAIRSAVEERHALHEALRREHEVRETRLAGLLASLSAEIERLGDPQLAALAASLEPR